MHSRKSFKIVVAPGTFKHYLHHTDLLVFFEFRLLPICECLSIVYLSFIRPRKISTFNVNDPEGVKYLTRLHLRFSHLNERKFRRGFLDTLNPLCNCNLEVEDNEHFSCAALILKMLEGPSSLAYQALIQLSQ